MGKEIMETTDYSIFRSVIENRDIKEERMEVILGSIRKKNLLHLCPLLVSADMYIIDGQHRLEAAKRLGLSVFYILSDEILGKEDVILFNTTQNNWELLDYAKSHAKGGDENYIKLLAFCRRNSIGLGPAIVFFGYSKRHLKTIIVGGKFVFDEQKGVSAEKVLKNYRDFLARCALCQDRRYYLLFSSYSFLQAISLHPEKTEESEFFSKLFALKDGIQKFSGYRHCEAQFKSLGLI